MQMLFIMFALSIAMPAWPQILPNSIDLKAAYCMRLLTWTSQTADPEYVRDLADAPTTRPDQRDSILSSVEKFERSLTATRSYLLPRLPYLDSFAVLAPMNAASRDIAAMNSIVANCFQKQCATTRCQGMTNEQCDHANEVCMSCSMVPSKASEKIKECVSATYLPF